MRRQTVLLCAAACIVLVVALIQGVLLARNVGPVPQCMRGLRDARQDVAREAGAIHERSLATRTKTDWAGNLKDFFAKMGAQTGWTVAWADDGSWDNFGLNHDGATLEGAEDRAPVTSALLRNTPGVCIAGFSKVAAGGRIQPHTDGQAGFSSGRIAVHLCLIGTSWLRVGSTWYLQYPGRVIAFDPEIEHEVVNRSTRDRTLLYINFDRAKV